jgi:hypothetical protein
MAESIKAACHDGPELSQVSIVSSRETKEKPNATTVSLHQEQVIILLNVIAVLQSHFSSNFLRNRTEN